MRSSHLADRLHGSRSCDERHKESVVMALTLLGLLESRDWKNWTALVLQAELMFIELAGSCPIYWACRVEPHAKNKERMPPEIEQ